MANTIIVLLDSEAGADTSISLLRTAAPSTSDIKEFRSPDDGIDYLRDIISAGDHPLAIVIGPELEEPAEAAQTASILAPTSTIIILARAKQAKPLRDQIASGSDAGIGWIIVEPEENALREVFSSIRPQVHVGAGSLEKQDNLHLSYGELAAILQSVGQGVTVQAPDGNLIYANDQAALICGYPTAQEFLAAPIADVMRRFVVMDESGAPFTLDRLPGRAALAGVTPPEVTLRIRVVETGEQRWTAIRAMPVFNDDGGVRFAVNFFRDITERKIDEERLRYLSEATQVLASSLDYDATLRTIAQMAVPHIADWCSVSLLDSDGHIRQVAVAHVDPEKVKWVDELNERYPVDPNASTGLPNVIRTGKAEFYPEISEEMLVAGAIDQEHLEIIHEIGFTSAMVVPIIARGRTLGGFTFVTAESKRHYTEDDLALANHLARRAAIAIDNAELYRDAEQRKESLRVTLSSIGDAVIATNIDGAVTFMNPIAERLTGWSQEEAIGQDLAKIFNIVNETTGKPVDNPVEKVLESGAIVGLANHTVLISRDGSQTPIDDSAAPIRASNGDLLGVVMVFHDVAEARGAEYALRESEGRYRTLAETASDAIITIDVASTILYINPGAEKIFGHSVEEMLGQELTMLMPDYLRHLHRNGLERYTETGKKHISWDRVELPGLHKSGKEIPLELSFGEAVQNGKRVFTGIVRDITDRKLAERRLLFLSQASEEMASSLDYERTLTSAAHLAVPEIADWCSIDMVGDDGMLHRLAVAHVDPEKVKWADELYKRFPVDMDAPTGVPNVIRTGVSEFYPLITDEMLVAAAKDEETLDLLRQIGYTSVIIAPITVQGRAIGAITFVTTESERQFDSTDLSMAEDLARRAGTAIDNAWLYRKAQEEIAERRHAEDELRISSTRFSTMIEQSPLSIQIFASDGTILQANKAWEEMWGTDRNALAGYNILRDEQLVERGIMGEIERSFAGEIIALPPVAYDPSETGRTGRPRWVRSFIYPVKTEDGVTQEVVLVLEDVTERRQAEEAIRESEMRFRSLADSAPVLIWMAGTDALRDYVNKGWLDFTGRTMEQELGNGWTERVHPDDLQRYLDRYRAAFRERENFRMEYRLHRVDGEYRWVLDNGIPRFTPDGEFAGYIGSCIDIHDRKESERELQRAKEEAEEANMAKDRFLAILSHELRTPLTPVLTLSQVLRDEDLPEDIHTMVEMIHRNAELEARLIDDLLDLTRIERGKLQLNIHTVDAHALLQNVIEIYKSDINGKQLDLSLKLDAGQHYVSADSARLQQIFWNLIKNAVKFTPEGGEVEIRTTNDRDGSLRIDVIDTGIGIAADTIPSIFNAFEQGEQNITRQYGGLGLGLAISRALVDLHGGTISATSEGKNRGSVFSIGFRTVSPPELQKPGKGNGVKDVEALPLCRILLVDDHADTQKVMKMMLERQNYHVHTAHDVSSGIEAAMSEPFDLLISDIGLPDGTGHDLMRDLRRRGFDLKGIALSGFGMEEDIRRSMEAGFEEHLTKPVSLQKLKDVITRLTEGSS